MLLLRQSNYDVDFWGCTEVPRINRRLSVFLVTLALNMVVMDPMLSALCVISDKWINANVTVFMLYV